MTTQGTQAGGMDVPRKRRQQIPRLYLFAGLGIVAIVALLFVLPQIIARSAGTVIDKSSIVTDTARVGTIARTVDGVGAFVPEHVRIVAASEPGVVDRIAVRVGTRVKRGTMIAELENPALQAALTNARDAVNVAAANLADARQQASTSIVASRSALNDARAVATSDALQARAFAAMFKRGLVPSLTYQQAEIEANKSANDVTSKLAELRLGIVDADAKVAASKAELERSEAELEQARAAVDALTVRSAADGIVQTVDVDPGASVPQTAALAKIADPNDLKVVLDIAEADAREVSPFMPARIDTGNGMLTGFVTRIAPSAQNGTVAVDIGFRDPKTLNERLDASVSGRVVVSEIPNALSITRPAGVTDLTTIELFKLTDNGARATRIRVRLGRGSSNRVQVLSGLSAGDTVIISDMTNYLDYTQLRIR